MRLQEICTMIQLANVSHTVGGQLATVEAFVVLATIHPRVYGKMKGCARVYGEYIHWQYLLSTHTSWYKYIYITGPMMSSLHYAAIASLISWDRFENIFRYLHFVSNDTLPKKRRPWLPLA